VLYLSNLDSMFPENGTQLRFNNERAHVMLIFSCIRKNGCSAPPNGAPLPGEIDTWAVALLPAQAKGSHQLDHSMIGTSIPNFKISGYPRKISSVHREKHLRFTNSPALGKKCQPSHPIAQLQRWGVFQLKRSTKRL
jgi:hypothetical protein